ncbi:linear amide C-N hydrolase [Ferrimonas pelagia]|uniref:Linear amide C-N hydrolase n=1 Tax=Ferrimonas pelagia TaxID=1177826 RepID=A0ABP9EIN6_9GAMM
MKPNLLKSMICGVFAVGVTTAADACTRVFWDTQEHGTFVSRTMDWLEPTGVTLINYPKGTSYKANLGGDYTYDAKYDVTGLLTYGALANATNSAGLSGNVLFDNNMVVKDGKQPSDVGVIHYLQHLISQFADVAEAVEYIQANPGVTETIPGVDMALNIHFSLQDISGDSAVIEFRDGESKIWHGPQYNVMTNQPDFDVHLASLDRAQRGWGEKETQGLYTNLHTGGNINPEDRFIHASYYVSHLSEPSSVMNGLIKLNGVPVIVPHDAPNRVVNGVMTGYASEYNVTEHLQSGQTLFNYQWGDVISQLHYNVNKIRESGKQVSFRLDQPGLAGDITQLVIDSAQ